MPAIKIGSPEHKELLCRFFIDTHKPFKPEELLWPDLDEAARNRLAALPIWDEALSTEAETAFLVQCLGTAEKDPLFSEAISLQGYEEQRHAEVLQILTRRYGIAAQKRPPIPAPADPNWAFMRVGYGECFDSFFAFGLFALARDSGFFPPALVDLFDPIMEEEGRHIIFHINWVAYCQAQLPYAGRPNYVFRRGLALWLQTLSRIKTGLALGSADMNPQDNFTMNAHSSFGDFSMRHFIETCIAENENRLRKYDSRLLRPMFIPRIAKAMLKTMPKGSPDRQAVAA